jgi:hypothetical protein
MPQINVSELKQKNFIVITDTQTGHIVKVIAPNGLELGVDDAAYPSAGLRLPSKTAPADTANKLYNENGTLTFDGTAIATGDITGVTAGTGLGGGGTSGDVTLNLDVNALSALGTTAATSDYVVLEDVTDNSTKKVLISNLPTTSGAPADAQYITLATDGDLSAERVLTAGTGISSADGGAGSTLTLALDVNELSALGTTAEVTDYVVIEDATDNSTKKLLISNLPGDIQGVTAGTGLSGGGTSGTVTLALDVNELSALGTTAEVTDYVVIEDATDNSTKKLLISNLPGDIQGVTAGTGLSGGGTSGTVTLALDVNELSALGATAETSDYLVLEDATDNSSKKVLVSNLPQTLAAAGWTKNGTDVYLTTATDQVGIGVTDPDVQLEVLDTGTQLKLSYDADSFATFAVDSSDDLTITPSTTGQIKLQPTTDSVDFFQVLDADGGTPVLNVDSTNERVGVGTAAPEAYLDIKNIVDDGTTNRTMLRLHNYRSDDADVNDFGPISIDFEIENVSGGAKTGTARIAAVSSPIGTDHTIPAGEQTSGLIFSTMNADTLAEAMRINAAGNVGIGVTDPDTQLEVLSTSTQLKLSYNGTYYSQFAVSAAGNLTITPSGASVGIAGNLVAGSDDTYDLGSSSYAWKDLYLEGDVHFTDAGMIKTDAGDLTVNAVGGDIIFQDNGSEVMRIEDGGQVGIGVSDPDAQLEVMATDDQLKLSYDGTHNTIIETNGSGNLIVRPSGLTFWCTAHLKPNGDDTYDLGAPTSAWKDLYLEGDIHFTDAGTVQTDAGDLTITANGGSNDVIITGDLVPAADDTYDLGTTSAAWQDLYLEGDLNFTDSAEIDVASGDLTVDVAGDIILDAAGDQIYFKDAGSTRFTFNLDSTPEIAVTGGLTIDCSSDITLDAANDIIYFKANNYSRIQFNLDSTPEIAITGNFTIDGSGDITLDAVTDITLNAGGGDIIFQDAGAERMRIEDGGQVGIGVSDPDAKLEIFSTSTQLKLSYDATNYTTLKTDYKGDLTIVPSGGGLILGMNLIPNADNTYDLGETSYAWKDLYLQGDIHFTDAGSLETDAGVLTLQAATDVTINAVGGDIIFQDNGTEVMRIEDGGEVGIGTTVPQSQLHLNQATGGTFELTREDASIAADDLLGRIYFGATDDGSTFDYGALIAAYADDTWDVGNEAATYLTFHTNWINDSVLKERMRIDADGDVGIGVTNPYGMATYSTTLHVQNNSTGGQTTPTVCGELMLSRYDTTISEDDYLGHIIFGGTENTTTWDYGASIIAIADATWDVASDDGPTRLTFSTTPVGVGASTERMVIKNDGNVGIGVTDPDTQLEVLYAGTQLKLSYDGTDNTTFGVDTAGDLTVTPSSGNALQPTQPAFLAYRANATGDQAITAATFTTVGLDTEVYDIGSDYNNTTFTFTAPVAGKYMLVGTARIDGIDSETLQYTWGTVLTSNRRFRSSLYDVSDRARSYWTLKCECIADMDASDTAVFQVYVRTGISHVDANYGAATDFENYFCGYLLG